MRDAAGINIGSVGGAADIDGVADLECGRGAEGEDTDQARGIRRKGNQRANDPRRVEIELAAGNEVVRPDGQHRDGIVFAAQGVGHLQHAQRRQRRHDGRRTRQCGIGRAVGHRL